MELPQIDPVHPGEILHDFITDNGTSVEAVAAATGISPSYCTEYSTVRTT